MSFIKCDKCKKTILERKPNGVFRFRFGVYKKNEPMVNIEIQGSVKVTCTRKGCRHVNIVNYLPTFN